MKRRWLYLLVLVPLIAWAATFTDDFAGTGALGSDWSACIGTGLARVSDVAQDVVGGASRGNCVSGVAQTNNQYAQAVLAGNQGSGRYAAVMVRVNGTDGSMTGYSGSLGGSNEYYISKINGADMAFGTTTFSIGDTMRLEAVGTSICLYVEAVEVDCATDGDYTSGQTGMQTYWEGSFIGFDSFEAGDLGGGGGLTHIRMLENIRNGAGPHRSQQLGGILEGH